MTKRVAANATGPPGPSVLSDFTTASSGKNWNLLSDRRDHSISSKTPELQHMFRRTHDPAQRREEAIRFFAETYYQKAREFSDTLTATFPPGSPGSIAISAAGNCTLTFEAYGQRYDLLCKVWTLDKTNPLHPATWWHNMLFNPNMHPDTVIFGFEPDWAHSTAEPET